MSAGRASLQWDAGSSQNVEGKSLKAHNLESSVCVPLTLHTLHTHTHSCTHTELQCYNVEQDEEQDQSHSRYLCTCAVMMAASTAHEQAHFSVPFTLFHLHRPL